MNRIEDLYELFLSACSGNTKSKWQIINMFEKQIKQKSGSNKDLEHTITLELIDFIDTINDKYDEYLKQRYNNA